MKRFLSWFRSPGGALIGLGALDRLLTAVWHWFTDLETARALWVEAGGSMPILVSMVSSIWFSPILIVLGFLYTINRWRLDGIERGRAYGQLIDKIGWAIFAASAVLLVSTFLFDTFLTKSGASDFAQYVKNERTERHLSEADAAKLIDVFKKTKPPFKIQVFALETPEALAYGREFMAAFLLAGQTVNNHASNSPIQDLGAPFPARLYSPKLHGLFVGVKSNSDVTASPEAIRFANTLAQADVKTSFVGWDNIGPEGFNFVVGPP
jgi:hypothetical protein